MERPLGGYAGLMTVYAGLTGAFAAWFRGSGRELPERMDAGDLALITVATHKASRIIAKDKVTRVVRAPFTEEDHPSGFGELEETVQGTGLRRAVGELILCPYCLGMWIATAFAAGLLVAPRLTRQIAAVLSAQFGADALHVAYVKGKDLG
jgi:hypothetical protein